MNRSFNGRRQVDEDDESGVYYLVKKPGTNGEKHLVRRPRAPLTSVPMDDDFDAYTYTQTVVSRYPNDDRILSNGAAANLSRSRSHGAAGSSSMMSPKQQPFVYRNGFDSGNDSSAMANTSLLPPPRRTPPRNQKRDYPTSPGAGAASHNYSPMSPQSRQQNPYSLKSPQRTTAAHSGMPMDQYGGGSKGKARQGVQQEVQETYEGYQQYIDEMEHMFSKHGEFDISLNRLNEASGTRENVTLGRVRSTKSNRPSNATPRSPLGPGGSRVEAGVARNTSSRSHGRNKAPAPTFQEVSRTVVENTKEKTVTISTWREQVAREVEDGIQRVSTYYQGDMQGYARSEMDDIARGSKSSGSGKHGYLDESRGFVRGDSRSEGQEVSTIVDPQFLKRNLDTNRSPSPHKLAESTNAQHAVSRPATPEKNNSASLTSSGSSSEHPPTPPPKPPRLAIKTADTGRLQSSTPVDSQMHTLPGFQPTKDGSVISTIRSTSSASSYTFDGILNTCKPSLAHLTGPLEKLGITTVEHLRALGDLNPNIRDRELKDDALRLGVTVMEWAILVDRLRML